MCFSSIRQFEPTATTVPAKVSSTIKKLGIIQFETDALIDQVQSRIDRPEFIQPVIKQLEDRYNLVNLEERLTAMRKR